MNLNNAKLHATAVKPEQFPSLRLPEVALLGRSNVGKSSLINSLLNRKKLAYVGAKPGKTRVINFYNVDDRFFLVDLPGYGYANVSKAEQKSWGKLIETYLYNREELKLLILLVDIRHKPTDNDILMYNWIRHYNIPFLIVATKSDKLSRSKMLSNLKTIKEKFALENEIEIIPYSSNKHMGRDELWKEIIKKSRI